MNRLFGRKGNKTPAPTLDEATDKLGARGDKIDERVSKLDEQLAKYKDQIKKTRPGPTQEALKRRALQLLKQKRLYQGQRDQLYAQQFNVDQTKFTVDSVADTVSTVQALSAASKQMKSQFKKTKELDINYIDKMQDDMFDMMDLSREINEAMGRSYEVPEDLDESDLMAELDGLEEDLALEEGDKSAAPSYLQEVETDMPEAPKTEQPAAHQAEAQALRS